MDASALKAWAAEYRRMNEWDEQALMERLPRETIEESMRAYFRLSAMVLPFAREADAVPELRALQMQDYIAITEKWLRLASRPNHVPQP